MVISNGTPAFPCRKNALVLILRVMKSLIIFMIFCAAASSAAFGQTASANTIAGLGYVYPQVTVAPGQLITVFVAGNGQGNISATVQDLAAPVLEVRPASACQSGNICSNLTAVTIQIPYELEPACEFTNPACDVVVATPLTVTVNGVAGAPLQLSPQGDRVHIVTTCDTVVPGGSGFAPNNGLPCAPLVTHANGSMVTSNSPAQGNEELVAYAVGLGLTTPAIPTGQAAATATPTYETFMLDYNFRPNALATQPGIYPLTPLGLPPVYSGLAPGYVGLYQVNFVVPPYPAGMLPCSGKVQSNLTVSVGGVFSFDGAGICVAP
jgi:uncharacterized protein (TIGR03437 family)